MAVVRRSSVRSASMFFAMNAWKSGNSNTMAARNMDGYHLFSIFSKRDAAQQIILISYLKWR